MGSVSLTNVSDMDDEHEACVAALNQLISARSYTSLEQVLNIFQTHFKHEEDLLDQYLYQNHQKSSETKSKQMEVDDAKSTSGFATNIQANMRASHFSDHKRMIQALRQQLSALENIPANEGGSTISETQANHQSRVVSNEFIKQVITDFETHAETYDTYGDSVLAARPTHA